MDATDPRPEPPDNYAQFIEQLDAASMNLRARHRSLGRTLELMGILLRQNELGLQLWEDRRARLGELMAKDFKSPDTAKSLRELQDVAVRMKSMFLLRTQRVAEKQSAVKVRFEEINKSLLDLERSKLKLHSSRTVSRDRENLNSAVSGLAGPLQGTSTADPGLREDLHEARRAIVLAEALLELKGK